MSSATRLRQNPFERIGGALWLVSNQIFSCHQVKIDLSEAKRGLVFSSPKRSRLALASSFLLVLRTNSNEFMDALASGEADLARATERSTFSSSTALWAVLWTRMAETPAQATEGSSAAIRWALRGDINAVVEDWNSRVWL